MKARRVVVTVLVMMSTSAAAQWLNYPTPGMPRTPDGKVNLSAPAPRLPDGKPDFSGIWETDRKYLLNITADLKPHEMPVLLPWAQALHKERQENFGKDRPEVRCVPAGVPKLNAVPNPFKIAQTPGLVAILYEAFTAYRQVFLDGRPLPTDPNPTWLGYSVGHYEGDTLVVESAGYNDKTWIDDSGLPHTDAMRVTERFRRRDVGHLEIQVTIDDPKTYVKPWTITEHSHLIPDQDLIEFVCNENEKDAGHIVGK